MYEGKYIMENYAELLFVNEVRDLQEKDGTREKYESFYPQRTQEALSERDIAFIHARESFYLASVSSTGWPYVQHRGGPKGFLKVIGTNRLGFADYRGNRQFITMGHAEHDDRVALFLMDYENKARLKMLGHLKMQHADEAESELVEQLATAGEGPVDRVATIDIIAIDWNCPKFIPELVGMEKVRGFVDGELQALKDENERLRGELELLKK